MSAPVSGATAQRITRASLRNLAILVSLSVSSATALSADLTREQQRQYYDAYGAVQGMIASLDAWDVQKKDPVLFKLLETESQK